MSMNVLVLAAGYGTRLGKDIAQDATGKYAHLAKLPKPLLPIGTKSKAIGRFVP